MATQSVRSYKFTTVRMLNYLKPGNGWTVDSVLTPADLTLTDIEVMWLLVPHERVGPSRPGTRPRLFATCKVKLYSVLEEEYQLLHAQQDAAMGSHRKLGKSNPMQCYGFSNQASEENGSP
jgi:hypothetical protein